MANKKDKPKYGLDRFLAIAHERMNPNTSTREGLATAMQTWACFELKTVPWDTRIMNASVEQLLIFYHMHKLKEDPQIIEKLDGSIRQYDDWADDMGAESPEEYAKLLEEWEKKEANKAEEMNLPDKVTTDFGDLKKFIDEENPE